MCPICNCNCTNTLQEWKELYILVTGLRPKNFNEAREWNPREIYAIDRDICLIRKHIVFYTKRYEQVSTRS